MTVSSAYQAFLMQHAQQNERLRQEILKHCTAKKIYLLGITNSYTRTETLFTLCSASKHCTEQYYVLVLIEKSRETTLSETQDKIENNLQHFISSTVIVLYLQEFIRWLLEGHPFANAIVQKATPLYEDDETPLPIPKPIDEEGRKKANEKLYKQTLIKVDSFLSGAELYCLRKEYGFSCFMLHQAAEQSLRAMLIITIGLRVISHNIDKMLRYASMFTHEAAAIFSKENKASKHLLKLLNDAYLDSRYREDPYNIALDDLDRLMAKVKRIKNLFEQHKP